MLHEDAAVLQPHPQKYLMFGVFTRVTGQMPSSLFPQAQDRVQVPLKLTRYSAISHIYTFRMCQISGPRKILCFPNGFLARPNLDFGEGPLRARPASRATQKPTQGVSFCSSGPAKTSKQRELWANRGDSVAFRRQEKDPRYPNGPRRDQLRACEAVAYMVPTWHLGKWKQRLKPA